MKRSGIDEMIMAQEGMERLSRREIEAMQLKKLNGFLLRAKKKGGIYTSLPDELQDLRDIRKLPFTAPEDLTEHAGTFLLTSQAEVKRVISETTSGTTGPEKRVFYTERDLEYTIQLYMAGIGEMAGPGSTVMICMPSSGPFGLSELISEAVRRLGARPLAAGTGLSYGELSEITERERPDCVIAMPVPLLSMLRVNGRGSLRKALVSADACPPSVEEACEKILGSRLFPHYGSREMGMAGAICCAAHEGMHLRENCVFPEIIGPDGEPVPDGEKGELVITTFGMEAMPLLRYRTGDLALKIPGICPCGSQVTRLIVFGRLDAASGMPALDDSMFRDPELVDFRAYQEDSGKIRIEKLLLSEVKPEDRAFYQGKRRILCSWGQTP